MQSGAVGTRQRRSARAICSFSSVAILIFFALLAQQLYLSTLLVPARHVPAGASSSTTLREPSQTQRRELHPPTSAPYRTPQHNSTAHADAAGARAMALSHASAEMIRTIRHAQAARRIAHARGRGSHMPTPASFASPPTSPPVTMMRNASSRPAAMATTRSSRHTEPPATPQSTKARLPDQARARLVASASQYLPSAARRVLHDWKASVDATAHRLGLNVSVDARTHRCRRFAVGSRKDFRGSIRAAFRALGLCETHSPYWGVFWGEQWLKIEQYNSRRIQAGALLNSIPGFRSSFGDKLAFAQLHDECRRRMGISAASRNSSAKASVRGSGDGSNESAPRPAHTALTCNWTKRAFNYQRNSSGIYGPLAEFRAHALALAHSTGGDRNDFPQLWILKCVCSRMVQGVLFPAHLQLPRSQLLWLEHLV